MAGLKYAPYIPCAHVDQVNGKELEKRFWKDSTWSNAKYTLEMLRQVHYPGCNRSLLVRDYSGLTLPEWMVHPLCASSTANEGLHSVCTQLRAEGEVLRFLDVVIKQASYSSDILRRAVPVCSHHAARLDAL